jgi:hypothetical protein
MKTYKETIIHIAKEIHSKDTVGVGNSFDKCSYVVVSFIYGVEADRIKKDVNLHCNRFFGFQIAESSDSSGL